MQRLNFIATTLITFVACCFASDVILNPKFRRSPRLKSLPYEDCGSRYDIVDLDISSCTMIPCSMPRGSTVMVNAIFNDKGSNTQFLRHKVRWIFNAIKTLATISPDPCDGQDECISNNSEGKSYWASVYVNNSLPVMRGTMVWEAGDDKDSSLICFRIPIYIKL